MSTELPVPSFALKDVTDDPFFTGGILAGLTEQEFREGLSRRLHEADHLHPDPSKRTC